VQVLNIQFSDMTGAHCLESIKGQVIKINLLTISFIIIVNIKSVPPLISRVHLHIKEVGRE
jgi:hypothetical protein